MRALPKSTESATFQQHRGILQSDEGRNPAAYGVTFPADRVCIYRCQEILPTHTTFVEGVGERPSQAENSKGYASDPSPACR
jgi:hypothetical protein